MESSSKTKPNVFIIESLRFEDEKAEYNEGYLISQILNLNDIKNQYYYIRTKVELSNLIEEFNNSNYRYLHLSMHGNKSSFRTTFEDVPFHELSFFLQNSLDKKRLFISACSVVNETLADNIFQLTGCNSIIGHNKTINRDDAAIFWASFYHLIFKKNRKRMVLDEIKNTIKQLISVHNIPITYYSSSRRSKKGYIKQSFK